ncbi:hypothetical protein FUAX_37680 [Fulvitalea axinellae]|uniref:RagB/SusD family nutrient uptake outer membrane protein n=1 Tax=Fulvitalea axinellae TaxID=1182444 RepID=A0AAU9DDR9_9BACT|nr:hypothetical protein FUAX_37680 [Fulvitalea axinellae]
MIRYINPIVKNLIFTFAVLCITSCGSFLDIAPKSDITDKSFWRTEEQLALATTELYHYFEKFNIVDWDNHGDDTFGNEPNKVSSGSYYPTSDSYYWDRSYRQIRKANNILKKAMYATSLPPVKINSYRGEAFFFRALAYFDLVSRFGGVPLILKTLDTEDEELTYPRSSRTRIVEQILSDLDSAFAYRPKGSEMNHHKDYGRITKYAALGFKSKVALFEASRAKYHGFSGYDPVTGIRGKAREWYRQALDCSRQVMESGEFALFEHLPEPEASYYHLFRHGGEGSPETMIANRFDLDIRTHGRPGQLIMQRKLSLTRKAVDMFLCSDGLPIQKSPLFRGHSTGNNQNSEFANRDRRLVFSVWKDNDPTWNGTPFLNNWNRINTGYCLKKYCVWDNDDPVTSKSEIDQMKLRYAEILLIRAEAVFELDGRISDALLDITVNPLRQRAGIKPLSNSFVTQNDLDMRNELRRERFVELCGEEGPRYWDLMRWKKGEELEGTVLGIKILKSHPNYEKLKASNSLNKDGYYVAQTADKRHFDPSKHYLWPLPTKELSLNSNLVQNPGW